MDWITGLNKTMDYIEAHLSGEIDYEQLARLACCSSYHYQRMFAYMAGVSLGEYIRRRRMSVAAADLQGGEKVLEVALKYGYQSPTAFNRAFQSVHGLPPSALRETGASVKAFPPLHFTITIKGVEQMEYRIEKREPFRVVGVSIAIDKDMEKNFDKIPPFWGKAAADGVIEKLAGMMDAQPMGILGVCACTGEEEWRYWIAAASTRQDAALEEFTVPAATWLSSPAAEPPSQSRSWNAASLRSGSPPPGTSMGVRRISRSI